MNSTLFTASNVIVQGITGAHGSFHTRAMLDAGTKIVAGTSPNKAGETVHGMPVFGSVRAIQDVGQRVDISIIFVPAVYARAAIVEAIEARVPLIIVITEGIPVHDMIFIKALARNYGTVIIGPNCPGVLLPGINKLGIIPAAMGLPGRTAIVSRSGTLTYEIMAGLSNANIGQRYVIGIGGDRVKGVSFIDCLDLFERDDAVDTIVLIGEIGGTGEIAAAEHIQAHIVKPVFAYVAGHTAPTGIQLGHAGAILRSGDESAGAKTEILKRNGVQTANSITELITLVGDRRRI